MEKTNITGKGDQRKVNPKLVYRQNMDESIIREN